MTKISKENKKLLEQIYMEQMLYGSTYIDTRQRPQYRKWVKNRIKKHGVDAYTKELKTDYEGNKVG